MRNFARSFTAMFIFNALIAIVLVTPALGYNRFTRDIDIVEGFNSLGSMFGGLTSFIVLLGLIFIGLVIWWSVTAIAENKDIENEWAGALAVTYVVVAVLVTTTWIDVPAGIMLIIVGFIVLVTVLTWINRIYNNRRPTV